MPLELPELSSTATCRHEDVILQKLLLEIVRFRFLVGAGMSTLLTALWTCSRQTRDYPASIACGGIFILLIQVVLFVLSSSAVQMLAGPALQERHRWLTIAAGFICAASAFVVPLLVELVTSSGTAYLVSTLLMLVGGPLLASLFLVKSAERSVTP